jgi:uncharacterized membrane protein HdeD (DUF308 family)
VRASTGETRWSWTLAAGLLIAALGAVAALLPMVKDAPGAVLVGWLLVVAGAAELGAGAARRTTEKGTGKATMAAGAATALAGLLFVLKPDMHIVLLSYIVITWLFIRTLAMLAAVPQARDASKAWLTMSAVADFGLGVVLVTGLPITHFVVSVFGPTREIVASFAWFLAASFLVTGLALIALALLDRGRMAQAKASS